MMNSHCDALAHVSYTNFGVSLFILLGILVSYLPQHIRIVSLRSSYGLSPYFVLLGTTSGTCALANILVLPRSRADVSCCREVDGFACLAGLLGIAQVGVQWCCFCVILLLFLIFFPRDQQPSTITSDVLDVPALDDNVTSKSKESLSPSYRTALVVVGVCVLHAALTALLSIYFMTSTSVPTQQAWANFLGIASAGLASIQYFPQIYTTFMLRRVGSLSIPMMCIQTPGSFVWAASLGARYGVEGWSTWGVYVFTGLLQGCLLGMGIHFELGRRRAEREELNRRPEVSADGTEGIANGQRETSEQTPLLRDG